MFLINLWTNQSAIKTHVESNLILTLHRKSWDLLLQHKKLGPLV